jgi:hypothetical protein
MSKNQHPIHSSSSATESERFLPLYKETRWRHLLSLENQNLPKRLLISLLDVSHHSNTFMSKNQHPIHSSSSATESERFLPLYFGKRSAKNEVAIKRSQISKQ